MKQKAAMEADCKYEEEQEIQQVAWRFMKKREKERRKQEEKERAKAERERVKAEKKALKALRKANKGAAVPLLESDLQMAGGGEAGEGPSGKPKDGR
ncbi:translation initiation factor IF-2-like isoform X2 [Penaeus japonicus]|uniref:translation initiation factor IF-2-like isoform X2 n=1 Tax=Penaeus japonicus TaxID=27405 RepID=UPI001C710571|nr:translation initiation factor IF-2-like isoform X2 [Penaeus japonicus]